jgi:hypothetical protein
MVIVSPNFKMDEIWCLVFEIYIYISLEIWVSAPSGDSLPKKKKD